MNQHIPHHQLEGKDTWILDWILDHPASLQSCIESVSRRPGRIAYTSFLQHGSRASFHSQTTGRPFIVRELIPSKRSDYPRVNSPNIPTDTPSPDVSGPSPRSNTSSKSSPASNSSTSTTTTKLRPILPRPAPRDGKSPNGATPGTTPKSGLGTTMDKVPWRTSGSKKGPFTVDSGGGGSVGQNPMSMQRQAQQGQVKSQARQVPPRRQQSGHSTPAASPGHRHSVHQAMPIYPQNHMAQNLPQMPSGPSRENSIYGNNALSSISTTPNPMTPIDNSFSSSVGRNFGPASFGNSFTNSYGTSPYMSSVNGSTTPVEPPPNWGVSPAQATDAFNWAHMPPQMSAPQQQQQQQQSGQMNDMTDMLDPQVFNSLAELLIQSQNSNQAQQQYQQQLPQIHAQQQLQQTQQQQQESFDLLSALAHAQGQMQSQQPTQQQVGSENSNSASLLTRRMQQTQPQQQYSRPNSVGGSANGTPNTSTTPQYSSPTYVNQQQTMLDPASMGRFPTPPQTFSSSFQQQNGRSIKSSSNPTTPWPIQDRQLGYSGTPVTTPGGSEYAYTSPIEVSLVRNDCAHQQNVPGPSRAPLPIQPRRREAPLPPAPTFHETPSQGSSFRSSHAPQHSSAQPGSQKSVSFKAMPEHMPDSSGPADRSRHQSVASGSGYSGSELPPLPPGFDLAQLAQLGGAGLEMAIRMGIEMGMNLNQQQAQPQAQQALSTAPPSPLPTSSVVSPISQNTSSPEKTRKSGRGTIVNNILHDNFLSSRAPPSAVASPVPLPSFSHSRRPSHGDTGETSFPEVHSPDEMAKHDPLASQVWKAYARDRGTLPNGARMENLTWRLMHLTLKKTEEREAKEAAEAAEAAAAVERARVAPEPAVIPASAIPERGRSKGKSRVVGFQGASSSPE